LLTNIFRLYIPAAFEYTAEVTKKSIWHSCVCVRCQSNSLNPTKFVYE